MKRIGKISSLLSVALAIGVSLLPQKSMAIATMYLDNLSGGTATITDNGAAVLVGGATGLASDGFSAILGNVTWAGSIPGWSVTVDVGTSKPLIGSATAPQMDLSFNALSTGAGTLKIQFSDNGFNYSGALRDLWGGTASPNDPNVVIENFVLINGQSVMGLSTGQGAFSGETSSSVTLVPSDVLTIGVIIRHSQGGQSTGDKTVVTPDGGLTLALLGMALAGVEGLRRRYKA